MKIIILVVVAAVAAAGAGGLAWLKNKEAIEARSALAGAKSELQKTAADLGTTRDELVALRKQFAEQQMALNQLQAEMTNARTFLEAEKAVSARLREELAKTKEEFATALKAGRAAQARPAGPMLYDAPKPTARPRGG